MAQIIVDSIIALATLALVGVAILQWLAFLAQKKAMDAQAQVMADQANAIREQGVTMTQSLKAAESANDLTNMALGVASDTAKQELRAYVCFVDAKVEQSGGAYTIKVLTKNVGKTPAFDVFEYHRKQAMWYYRTGKPPLFTLTDGASELREMGPTQEINVAIEVPGRLPAPAADLAYTGIYIFIGLEYRDIFSDKSAPRDRHTEFCGRFEVPYSWKWGDPIPPTCRIFDKDRPDEKYFD